MGLFAAGTAIFRPKYYITPTLKSDTNFGQNVRREPR